VAARARLAEELAEDELAGANSRQVLLPLFLGAEIDQCMRDEMCGTLNRSRGAATGKFLTDDDVLLRRMRRTLAAVLLRPVGADVPGREQLSGPFLEQRELLGVLRTAHSSLDVDRRLVGRDKFAYLGAELLEFRCHSVVHVSAPRICGSVPLSGRPEPY